MYRGYLHAEMPKGKTILLKLRGQFVDLICEVNPVSKQYIRYVKNVKVLHSRVLRALYGFLEPALLWYNLYSTTVDDLVSYAQIVWVEFKTHVY